MGRERYVVGRSRAGPVGTLDSRGKEPSAKDCPGPYPAEGGRGLGDRAHRGGAGHLGGYGVPYQAAVPGGRPEAGLGGNPRPGHPTKLDERGEAHLIALACSQAPPGHDHWTLRLLASKVVELGLVPSMSHEGIRKRLKKTVSSRGRRRSGVFPR